MWHEDDCERPPPLVDEDAVGVQKVSHRASPRPYLSTKWTHEQDQELIQDWMDNLTCSHIAHRIGKTRNAIIGRAHRIGLPRRNGPAPIEIARARKVQARRYLAEVPKLQRVVIAKPRRPRIEQPAGLPDPPLAERAATFLEIGVDCCKYPLDTGWCNRPRWHGSQAYCRTHHERCNHKGREM